MADKKYNEVKLGLTVAKSGLTKAIKKLEECGKEMNKLKADLTTASMVRVAASLLEALDTVSKKNKEVRINRDKWLDVVVEYDPVEFVLTVTWNEFVKMLRQCAQLFDFEAIASLGFQFVSCASNCK